MENMDVKMLGEFLINKAFPEALAENFRKNQVNGNAFLSLQENDLKDLIGLRARIRQLRDSLVSTASNNL